MTDITYPAFEQYQPATAAYLRTLLQPYHDALMEAETIESLTAWVPLVVPESADELNKAIIASDDLEQGKLIVLETLASTLLTPENHLATPWNVSSTRNEISARLFGPATETVSVIVTNGPNSFQHDLGEELMYGLLVGLSFGPGFIVSIGGVEVTRTDYDDIFTEDNRPNFNYVATVGENSICFYSPDFIQGITTAAEWIGLDPHTIVTNLVQMDDEGNEIPITF